MFLIMLGALLMLFGACNGAQAMFATSADSQVGGLIAAAVFLVPGVALIALGLDHRRRKRQTQAVAGRYPCPFCAELILRAATVCPHCRSQLTQAKA